MPAVDLAGSKNRKGQQTSLHTFYGTVQTSRALTLPLRRSWHIPLWFMFGTDAAKILWCWCWCGPNMQGWVKSQTNAFWIIGDFMSAQSPSLIGRPDASYRFDFDWCININQYRRYCAVRTSYSKWCWLLLLMFVDLINWFINDSEPVD